MAEDADVDLVEVAPNAVPPVCRLMDYGKFRYQEQKKAQEAKAKQKVVQIKEVKFRPATDENDFQTKLRSLVRFLSDGDKAKVTLRFRGREMAHQQFGAQLMDRVRDELADVAQVEHTEARRPSDDHGSRPEKEALIFHRFDSKSSRIAVFRRYGLIAVPA